MKPNPAFRLLSLLVILTMVGNMVFVPGAAQARQQAAVPPAVAAVVNGGERYMDAAPQVVGNALHLAQLLDYLDQTDLQEVSETTLVQARRYALATAQQAAQVQGTTGTIVNGLRELGYQAQAPADLSAEVSELQSNGFESDLASALVNLGLSQAQIDSLETETTGIYTGRNNGLPAETETALQQAGLSPSQIEQVEQALADYGLADESLPDRVAQLKATQAEMSAVRTQALVTYIQLLVQQVFKQRLEGQTGRTMTAADVDSLVKDQLRLLIHLGYLETLWNNIPEPDKPEVGEGQWLFVERYSLRVAERLDSLILETHNVGLVVDLLVALQLHGTALAALAGDARYAEAELVPLKDLLATLLGDNLPGGQGYGQATPPLWWKPALALGEHNPALAIGYEPSLQPAAVVTAQAQAQGRIKGLASPLWFPAAQGGSINEIDETNNVDQAIFHTALPPLPPGVLDILTTILGGSTPTQFLVQLLTGQSDNWWAIGGNIVLSCLPVTGTILDLVSLITDPVWWVKAMAFIGILSSLMSDAAEVLLAIGVIIPPSLALTATGSALWEAIDMGAAILKHAQKFVNTKTFELIRKIPFDKALKLGGRCCAAWPNEPGRQSMETGRTTSSV